MAVDPAAVLRITALSWAPPFARGHVRDLRARWACEELGLDYAERLIDPRAKPEPYFAEQPWGQVPVLHDGDLRLFESGAILLHLSRKAPDLLPADRQGEASAIGWLFAALNSVEPWMFELSTVDVFARGEEWAKLRRPSLLASLGERLDRLADVLGDKDWLEGGFTVGDLAMASVLRIAEKSELLRERPTLDAYLERATARPAFQRALSAQLAAFDKQEKTDVR